MTRRCSTFLPPRGLTANTIRPSSAIPLLGTAVIVVLAGRFFGLQFAFKYDDSFITFRVAERLAALGTYTFNDGDSTNAASSLLFTMLLAGASLLRISPPLAADLMSVLGLWLCTRTVYQFVARGGGSARRGRGSTALLSTPAILIFFTPVLLYWLGSGMETLLFLGVFCHATSYALKTEQNSTNTLHLSAALSVLVLLRFDGFVFVAATVIPLILFRFRNSTRPELVIFISKLTSLPMIIFTCQVGFNLVVTGNLIPDSAHQKSIHPKYSQTWVESSRALSYFLRSIWLAPVVCGIALLFLLLAFQGRRLDFRKAARPGLILVAQFIGILTYLSFTPHSDYSRYFLPLFIPPAMLLAVGAHSSAERRTSTGRHFRGTLLLVAVGFAASSISLVDDLREIRGATSVFIEYQMAREEIGKWMEENLDGATVLSGSLASIAYHNPSSRFLDFSGLTSRGLLNSVEKGVDPRAFLFGSSSHHVEMTWRFSSSMPADWDSLRHSGRLLRLLADATPAMPSTPQR